MKEKINCPVCRKRAFDICSPSKGEIWIELKCPHCRNIVQIRHRGVIPCGRKQRSVNRLTKNY